MADNTAADLTHILTAIQDTVVAVNSLSQILAQATVNSSSLRVAITGVSTTVGSTTSGTVTQVNTGSGLTGGPITTTGTISLLSSIGTGTVTQVNTGIGLTGGPITTSGSLAVSLTTLTNSISSNIALNNTANFFDGPSVAQGSSGTWLAVGSVTAVDNAGIASILAKLWDGTTIIDSGAMHTGGAGENIIIALSGTITSPSGNIRISVKDATSTSGNILANASGASKDSTVTAVRIG